MQVNPGAAAWVAAQQPPSVTSNAPQPIGEGAAPTLHSRPASASSTPTATPADNSEDKEQKTNAVDPAQEVQGWMLQQARQARVKDAEATQQERVEREQIRALAARDREVRAHEQAHVAVGGRYAGAPKYQYERGPDGVHYAVGGEVPISTGKEATPQETLIKAQIVRRAALAPAEPSAQDYQVAAQASRLETQARQELAELQAKEHQQALQEAKERKERMAPEGAMSEHAINPGDLAALEESSVVKDSVVKELTSSGRLHHPWADAATAPREKDASYRIIAAFHPGADTSGGQIDRYV